LLLSASRCCESATNTTPSARDSTALRVPLCCTCPGTVNSLNFTSNPEGA
jgi:hypothetical protein